MLLGVGRRVFGYVGRRIAPSAIGYDLVAPGKEVDLRLPTGNITGEFVAQDQWDAAAGYLIIEIYSVNGKSRHT